MGKSKAMQSFGRRMDQLLERIQRGVYLAELEARLRRGDPPGNPMVEEFEKILADTMPHMTEEERAELQKIQLRAHQRGAELLAEHDLPVPGSDPKRPN